LSTEGLVDNFFRHEYGRMVSVLARRVGARELDAVEDAVQSALVKALDTWPVAGQPDNPSAWLFRVASNRLLGELRQRNRRGRLLEQHGRDDATASDVPPPTAFLADEVRDDMLRMLFACCDESLPVESQLALALKLLCGFDIREIALRLFTSEANVYKRIERARKRLRDRSPSILDLAPDDFATRLGAVLEVLYLMFTEAHLSSRADEPIRRELCDEAIRLATLAAEHPLGRAPQTSALLALMHLHAARMSAREDPRGALLLLEEQDRSLWDTKRIHLGLSWLADAARGDTYSRYHAEAAIAAEHCLAPSVAETRWDKIEQSYAFLETIAPSAMHAVNRALAVAQLRGPGAGLALLDQLEPPAWLRNSYVWPAVLSDLHRRAGDRELAASYAAQAIGQAPSDPIRALLRRRLQP